MIEKHSIWLACNTGLIMGPLSCTNSNPVQQTRQPLTHPPRETVFHYSALPSPNKKPALFSPKLQQNGRPETNPREDLAPPRVNQYADDKPPINRDILLGNHIPERYSAVDGSTFSPFAKKISLVVLFGTFPCEVCPLILVGLSNTATAKDEDDVQGEHPSITIWLSESDARHNEMRGLRVAGKHR